MPLAPSQPDHEYCAICSALAAGRCASCHAPVCADCAALVHGGATTFAVCERCKDGHRTMGRALLAVAWPVLLVLLVLAAALTLLVFVR